MKDTDAPSASPRRRWPIAAAIAGGALVAAGTVLAAPEAAVPLAIALSVADLLASRLLRGGADR